jgi:hypothetical protein
MLAPALDSNDPFSAMLLNGSEQHILSPYYPWGNHQGKMGELPATYSGMPSTLAPSALDKDSLSQSGSESATLTNNSEPSYGLTVDFGGQDNEYFFHGPGTSMDGANGGFTSGQTTPGEGFWDFFVQDGGWNKESTAS